MTHYEWQMAKVGTSWKAQMKSDMDNAAHEAHSYEDFISRMQTKGYKVKGETFGDNALKYLSFSASGQTRFIRVTEKNFGVGYTKEAISDRIEKRVKAQEKFPVKKKIPFPKRSDAKKILIDTDKEKFQANGALKHWADIQNLKIAAASYAEGGSVEELERKITEKNATVKTARSEIVDLEHEMKAKAEILKYAKQYVANRKYQWGYEKAKDQDAYFRSHETQIILFGGAENMLKRYGIKTTSLDVEKMQVEYDAMTVQKAKLKKTYQTAEKEVVEADKQLKNIRQYLGIERDKEEKEKTNKKHDISYEKCGDYLIPNLVPNPEPEGELRKFGLMRKSYLEKHRRGIYSGLLLSGKLKENLLMIQEQAEERFDLLIEQMAKQEGVTEQLKEQDQMLWVRRMNSIRARAEEIVREEIIYCL